MSRVLDVINSPWAILPEKLDTIALVYDAKLRGEKLEIDSFFESDDRSQNKKPYDVIKGVGVVSIHGVLAKRMNLFHAISGGASHEMIGRAYQQALNDRDVKAIILDVDSPGGTVDGTAELSGLIFDNRNKKKTISLANGLMASAGYWIGSATGEVVLSGVATDVGSIGVVATHVDYSEQDKKRGITVTEVYSGKYKRIVSQNKALDSVGRAHMQERVDYLYKVFLETVAKHLGSDAETVHNNMADGRIFTGQQAIDAGLATRFATLDELIDELAHASSTRVAFQPRATAAQLTQESKAMDKITIANEHPEIAAAFRQEGHDEGFNKGKQAGVEEGKKLGADAERQRIQEVEAQSIPGHEAMINELRLDGKTTGAEAAVKVLAAEKAKTAQIAKDVKDEAPPAQQHAALGGDDIQRDKARTSSPKATAQEISDVVASAAKSGKQISYSEAKRQVLAAR